MMYHLMFLIYIQTHKCNIVLSYKMDSDNDYFCEVQKIEIVKYKCQYLHIVSYKTKTIFVIQNMQKFKDLHNNFEQFVNIFDKLFDDNNLIYLLFDFYDYEYEFKCDCFCSECFFSPCDCENFVHNKCFEQECNITTKYKLKSLKLSASVNIETLSKTSVTNKLIKLDCENMKIKSLDWNLVDLQELNCSRNKLTSFDSIQQFVNLQKLNCYGNGLKSLNGIHQLVNLQELNCGGNNLTSFDNVQQLVNLRKLDYDRNGLKTLDGIQYMVNKWYTKFGSFT